MSTREQGLRRTAAVTIGITAASVVGTAALAGAAWAQTGQHTSGGTATTSAGTSGSSTGDSSPGGSVSSTDGQPHATSGGS
jgi:hypothetical protein